MKKVLLALIVLLILYSCNNSHNNGYYSEIDINRQVDSIMGLMTLDEKIGQTIMYSGDWNNTGPYVTSDNMKFLKEGNLGSMLNVYTAKGTRELQKIAVNETRLGIPLIFGYDVIHGFKTIFPINIGIASSWDLESVHEVARISAEEASASGVHWTFAPMIDIARDPRWGRISEGSGEDVFLTSEIAKAYVKGFQGKNLSNINTILACAKHFVGYGAAQAGRDYHTVSIGDNELRNVYMPPFKSAIDAGVETFMTAFNELDGVPATANQYVFQDILNAEWGFSGLVVSDYTAINELVNHGYAKNEKHAAELAIKSGVDIDMMSGAYRRFLKELIIEGKIEEKLINEACRKILEAKFKLGLFDDPYKYSNEKREEEIIYQPEFLESARKIASRSCVLLKNSNKALPLNKKQTIALIGPLANDKKNILGSWAGAGDRNGKAISIFQGIKEYLDDSNIMFAKGCDIESNDDSGFDKAINIAKKSDKIIIVLGEDYNMSGEAASRTSIKLPGIQTQLIKAIRNELPNKEIILILMNGRPLDLTIEDSLADAILEVWFPGTSGGLGVADILFGKYNPSGKLPITFPRNIGQVPIYYNEKNTGRPISKENPKEDYKSNYLDSPNTPLYPFGYGLSYTSFEYSETNLSNDIVNESVIIKASSTITNNGDYDGHEVVQLYIRDKVGSITRPVKELKGFKKIFLRKGESKTVVFEISAEDLKFYKNGKLLLEPGEFEISISPSSDFEFNKSFNVVLD